MPCVPNVMPVPIGVPAPLSHSETSTTVAAIAVEAPKALVAIVSATATLFQKWCIAFLLLPGRHPLPSAVKLTGHTVDRKG